MFLTLTTQIRVGGMGQFVGFDLSAIYPLLLAYDVPVNEWRFVLEKLSLLTSIAVKYWNTDKESGSKSTEQK